MVNLWYMLYPCYRIIFIQTMSNIYQVKKLES